MNATRKRPAIFSLVYIALVFSLGSYFVFAAVQGDYGLFRRVQIDAESATLQNQLTSLQTEVARMQNKTHRMSDDYLDLDLLDEQARNVLGMIRKDEIIIR